MPKNICQKTCFAFSNIIQGDLYVYYSIDSFSQFTDALGIIITI